MDLTCLLELLHDALERAETCLQPLIFLLADIFRAIEPRNPHDLHWYMSPYRHAVEFVLVNLFCVALLWMWTVMAPSARRRYRDERVIAPPLGIVLTAMRAFLTVYFITQPVYKVARNSVELYYMLNPCHVNNVAFLYCLWTRDYQRASAVFQVCVHFSLYAVLAIAFPDLDEMNLPLEYISAYLYRADNCLYFAPYYRCDRQILTVLHQQFFYFVGHAVLLVMPLWCMLTGRFVEKQHFSNFVLAAFVGVMWHWDVLTIGSMVSGLNLNQVMWPPPDGPSFLMTSNWRLIAGSLLLVLAFFTGMMLPVVLKPIGRVLNLALTPHVSGSEEGGGGRSANREEKKQK